MYICQIILFIKLNQNYKINKQNIKKQLNLKIMLTPQSKYFSGKFTIKTIQFSTLTTIKSNNISFSCTLSCQNIQKMHTKLIPSSIKINNNKIQLSDYIVQNNTKNKYDSIYSLSINNQNQHFYHYMMGKKYRCIYQKSQKILKLYINLQHSFQLTLHQIEKPRFAKTKKLQNLLQDTDTSQFGIVSMDQMGRILVQQNQCNFPRIGIWLKCKTITQKILYLKILQFLKQKPNKKYTKLITNYQNNNYIHFVRIFPNQLPQLYFVSWKEQNLNTVQKQILKEYQVKLNKNVVLQFGEEYLEFTLRNKNKVDQEYGEFVSPKKQITNQQLQDQLQRLHIQESPQFSSIKKDKHQALWQQQRAQLYNKISSQQQQIQSLKMQIQILKKQVIKTNCNNITSPSQKNLAYFKSPNINWHINSQTPKQKFKKLSSSDLETSKNSNIKVFQSGSTKQKNSIQEGSHGDKITIFQDNYNIKSQQRDNKRVLQSGNEQDPWDMIQLIE